MPRIPSQGTGSSSKVPSNNNPRGKNQYKDCPAPDDPRISDLLKAYQREGITDRKKISKLLRDEHAIVMSDSTVARRRRELGLKASGKTTADLPDDLKRQLVLDQMAKDAAGKIGTQTVKTRIFQETGIDLTRDWIRKEMQTLAPEAYEARKPHRKGTSQTKHQLSGNSTNGGSLFAEDNRVSQNNSPHDHLQPDHSRPAEISPSHTHQLLPAPGFIISTQLRDMIAETEAKMITLTQYLRALGPATGPLDDIALQNFLKCIESAALLEWEIARVMST